MTIIANNACPVSTLELYDLNWAPFLSATLRPEDIVNICVKTVRDSQAIDSIKKDTVHYLVE